MKYLARPLFVGALALALAACSDEQTAETAPPRTADPPVATEPAPSDTAERDRAVEQMRDGARSIAEGAGTLLNQGRDDAGPALERAGDYTRELGRIARGAAEQAAADLRDAAAELNRRIEEAQTETGIPADDPQARLPSSDRLRADTLAAARAHPAGVGPNYVGVWAGDAAQCARIDQEPVELMAVITPTTIRRYESVCNIDGAPLTNGTATLAASCIAEGETEDRQILLSIPSPGRLEIGSPDVAGRTTLVRCHLG